MTMNAQKNFWRSELEKREEIHAQVVQRLYEENQRLRDEVTKHIDAYEALKFLVKVMGSLEESRGSS